MARFDIHRLARVPGYVVDCQATALSSLETRFVVPLRPLQEVEFAVQPRLCPTFMFAGQPHVLLANLALTVPKWRLGKALGSLRDEEYPIIAALDYLLTGV